MKKNLLYWNKETEYLLLLWCGPTQTYTYLASGTRYKFCFWERHAFNSRTSSSEIRSECKQDFSKFWTQSDIYHVIINLWPKLSEIHDFVGLLSPSPVPAIAISTTSQWDPPSSPNLPLYTHHSHERFSHRRQGRSPQDPPFDPPCQPSASSSGIRRRSIGQAPRYSVSTPSGSWEPLYRYKVMLRDRSDLSSGTKG